MLEEAYDEATRTASRMSMMGALGFGVALAMAAVMVTQGGFFAIGFGLEMVLFVGGIGGGLAFTMLALRASKMARACRRRLDDSPEHGRGGGKS